MSDSPNKVWQWIVSVLLSIVLTLAGAWASHVNSQLEQMRNEIISLKILTARIADKLQVEPNKKLGP